MKTVFTNSMCAHVWAQLKQPHGRSGSMKFDGAVAYSYSTPVAHIIAPQGRPAVALFVPNSWGVTTGAHLSYYKQSASQFPQFEVPQIFAGYDARRVRDNPPDHELHAQNVTYLVGLYNKERDALLRCPSDSWRLTSADVGDDSEDTSRAHATLRRAADVLTNYGVAFGLTYAAPLPWQADADKAIARRDRLANDPKRAAKRAASALARERAEEKRIAQRAEQRRLDALGAAERVAAWQAGAIVSLHYGDVPSDQGVLLRLRGDDV